MYGSNVSSYMHASSVSLIIYVVMPRNLENACSLVTEIETREGAEETKD